jgi:molybdopterin/thiamine biosynthesis adenylyltransferase
MTFLEEGPMRDQRRRNWVFAQITLENGLKGIGPRFGAQALTLDERQRRTPELVGLAAARVLLVGAGSLGAPVAQELVKAGVGHVDLVDPDQYDVNNAVRHILPILRAGDNKAHATAAALEQLNPFVEVRPHLVRVGGEAEDAALLAELIANADVVVDTTGSVSVGRILQRWCTERTKPLIVGGLSSGSYGGEVAIFRPDGACFECLLLAQRDNLVPRPHAAPRTSQVTPVGCSHPAFAGAGFDATQLAALIARTVIQTTGKSTYPDADFDWAITNFRSTPKWRSGRLDKHPDCDRCR